MSDSAEQAELEVHDMRARLWARAHHEAAHAVVGTLLGGHVVGVELWSGPPVGGRVRLTGLDASGAGLAEHGLVRQIAYLLSGPIGESIAGSATGMIQNEAASAAATALAVGLRDPKVVDRATDLGMVTGLIIDYFGPENEGPAAAAADHLPLSVESLVREHWAAVQLVVAGLLRDGRLTEEQFQSLVTLALPSASTSDLLDALPARSDVTRQS